MPFDVGRVLAARSGENFALHEQYLNHQLARMLKTLGFDRNYVRGEGCYLYDDAGDQYLDFLSGFGVYALGRSHPAHQGRAAPGASTSTCRTWSRWTAPCCRGCWPSSSPARAHAGIDRVFFCNSGAEAVESAIKFARQATQRPQIVYAEHAFHGLTTGALSLNGGEEFRDGFGDLLPGTARRAVRRHRGAATASSRSRRRGGLHRRADPGQGRVHARPPDYWQAAQELCRRYGTLLVIDEVQTGLGRTGKFFCHEHWDLEPDIITVSKALSGGYIPVGAMLTTEKIFASVYSSIEKALKHSTTFGRNQLAMVAGLATLAAFDDEDIVAARPAHRARVRRTRCAPLPERYEMLHDVRGLGLMIGIEFGDAAVSPALPPPVQHDRAAAHRRCSRSSWSCRSSTGTGSSPRSRPTTSTSSSCCRR